MLDGQLISALLIGISGLIAYLVSQTSTKGKALRKEVRVLRRREIANARWRHRVELDYASHGLTMPKTPKELSDEDDNEDEPW